MEARITNTEFFDALFSNNVEIYRHPAEDSDPDTSFLLFVTVNGVKKDIEVKDGKIALLFELNPQTLDKVRENYIHKEIEGLKKQYKELRIKIKLKQKEERQLRLNAEL